MMEEEIIKLKTSDDKVIEVRKDILKKSKLLKDLIDDEENNEIMLKEIDELNLKKIIDYLNHYKDNEPKKIPNPFPAEPDAEFFRSILNDDWTFDFLNKLKVDETVTLVNAAEYLQIEGLIEILAAKLSYEMTNCSVEEARQKFQIEDDLTEEERAELDKYPLD